MPSLLPHQSDALRMMVEERRRGMLLYHCMGSGKTISALSIGAALRSRREINEIVVLCPVNVKKAWEKEAHRCGMLVHVMTHNSFKHAFKFTDKTLLIVDEAHNFRTKISSKKKTLGLVKDVRLETQKSYQLLQLASRVSRVLLLSGTPIVNSHHDLRNLVMAMKGDAYLDRSSYKDPGLKGGALLKNAANMTHAYLEDNNQSHPAVIRHTQDFQMTDEYQKWYETVEADVMSSLMITNVKFEFFSSNTRAFWNGVRRATNGRVGVNGALESPKMEWLTGNILKWKQSGEKAIIYSAWKTYGMELMKEYISTHGGDAASVRIGVIDGSVRDADRAAIVRDFNADALDILLFTAAGSEGMNLLATRHVVILEPHWNIARTEQAVCRAVRMNSHSMLPPEDRNVSVYHLLLHKKEGAELESIDDMMTAMGRKKVRIVRKFNRVLGIVCNSTDEDEEMNDDDDWDDEDEDDDWDDDDD
jgi:superfamily II DNA or RNA helicase